MLQMPFWSRLELIWLTFRGKMAKMSKNAFFFFENITGCKCVNTVNLAFLFLCQRGELWLPTLEVLYGCGQLEEITLVYLLVCCVLPPS